MDTSATLDEAALVGADVRSAVVRMYRRFRADRAGELGDASMAVLSFIQREGPQSLTALAEREFVSVASMSQLVSRLVASNLVTRTGDLVDRRRVMVAPTDEGVAIVLADRARRHAWFDGQLRELSPDDLEALRRSSQILIRLADTP